MSDVIYPVMGCLIGLPLIAGVWLLGLGGFPAMASRREALNATAGVCFFSGLTVAFVAIIAALVMSFF